jgi:heptosyltransferase-1
MLSFSVDRILLVRLSSLGDLIQTFETLTYLSQLYPKARIDWAVESELASLIEAHPDIQVVHRLPFRPLRQKWRSWKALWQAKRALQSCRYDLVVDLQGNIKSGLVTWWAVGRYKVGRSFASAREWPNGLFTRYKVHVPSNLSSRQQSLFLVQQALSPKQDFVPSSRDLSLRLSPLEKNQFTRIQKELSQLPGAICMICVGAHWENKRLSEQALIGMARAVQMKIPVSWVWVGGTEKERIFCQLGQQTCLAYSGLVLETCSLPVLQHVMQQVKGIVGFDSSLLHLAATTSTPTLSFFGPTKPSHFAPQGKDHYSFLGCCPYEVEFRSICPRLRTCKTGACLKQLESTQLADWCIDALGKILNC